MLVGILMACAGAVILLATVIALFNGYRYLQPILNKNLNEFLENSKDRINDVNKGL